MTIIIDRRALKSSLRQCQWALGAVAAALLGYCGFVLADSWMFQHRESIYLKRILQERQAARIVPAVSGSAPTKPLPPMEDGLLGRIDIPRLGVSVMVVEGTGTTNLRRAVGHIPGTALPGESGNVAISGHRDTFFRPLRNITRDDIITLTTPLGEYRYRVVSTKIVRPDDVAVLKPGTTELLTLITCYPFYYIGAAPNRFIVRAERVI